MGSANYPTPAELDAYAEKVANNPLTIQIFPNSVKVPQRKHIRRTVNGLDTSSSSQRQSPYPTQVSSSRGLLAVLRVPAKGIVKELDGSRGRHLHKTVMNLHNGTYVTQSTLNAPQSAPHLQGPAQPVVQTVHKQSMVHSKTIQQQQSLTQPMTLQAMPHPQALQQRSVPHSQVLQRQQRLSHPQGIQRQQGVPLTQTLQQQQSQSCQPVVPPQHHLQMLNHKTVPPKALHPQQGLTEDLHHMPDGTPLMNLQHTQGLAVSQTLPQTVGAPPTVCNGLQQPPVGTFGPRKLPDAEAPPNVTVSTSTIPLSMAASLQQNRPGDLSSIVHQINQLCQARAGMGATSVCEGQIANPSPISRNLLISASSRVSSLHPALGSVPSCLMVGPSDKTPCQTSSAALLSQPNMSATNSVPAFHTDTEKVHLQQLHHHIHQQKQQQHLQQFQQHQQRSWAQHQLSHMHQPHEGAHPCKNPRMEPPSECAFPSRNLSYSHKLPTNAQFPLKHPAEKPQPSPPVNCPIASLPYINGHYIQPPWSSVPATAGNSGSGPQDLPVAFQREQAATSTDHIPGTKYLPANENPNQAKLMQSVEFLGQDFQIASFQEQNMNVMGKMHRSAMGQVQEVSSGSGVHTHHPVYR